MQEEKTIEMLFKTFAQNRRDLNLLKLSTIATSMQLYLWSFRRRTGTQKNRYLTTVYFLKDKSKGFPNVPNKLR